MPQARKAIVFYAKVFFSCEPLFCLDSKNDSFITSKFLFATNENSILTKNKLLEQMKIYL